MYMPTKRSRRPKKKIRHRGARTRKVMHFISIGKVGCPKRRKPCWA